jgi:predicted ATPase/DNA-binding SARP family transcriptional activator/DNA-binding CsgD family transcriptional regulator
MRRNFSQDILPSKICVMAPIEGAGTGMAPLRSSIRERPDSRNEKNVATEAVRAWLLGGFRISVGSREIGEGEWPLKKAASLAKLLALSPGHRLHREVVMERLWSDLGSRAAANNLRGAIHVLRRAFGPHSAGYVSLRDEEIHLCPDERLWVDVDAFEDAARTARLSSEPAAYRAAAELYAGELLPEDRYEDWAEERRRELRATYLEVLLELAELYEDRREYRRAIEVLKSVLAEEPAREEAYAGLVRLYALAGCRSEALRQYGLLEETIRREFGAEPDTDLRRLREEILAGRFPQEHPEDRRPTDFPETGPHNLSVQRSSFVGRERDIGEIKRLLSMTGLLTLTGAGGSGKTRLALEVARDLVGLYPDGVWLVELAPLSEEDLVPQAVAATLEVSEQPGRQITETVVSTIGQKKLLLVLDNCEHLVDATARLADTLLNSCPDLRILATSREPLAVTGEIDWRVLPLSMPGDERSPFAEDLTRYESVRLFQERARLRLPAFEITQHNARSVAEVCRRLDGIPLAIELATARMGALAVEQVAERLEDSLGLLSGGARTASPRQRTMRATIGWSHELLSEPEKRLFERLSVFAGGWTLEAAEAVGEGIEEGVLDLHSRLVDKSLVVAEAGSEGVPRYGMLGPVRRYAREKLEEDAEAGRVFSRHAAFFLDVAEEAEPQLRGPDQLLWLERLTKEHDNLRAAMRWLLEAGEPEKVARFGWALWLFWWIRGRFTEGRRWMEEALASGEAMPPRDRAKALFVAGTMATGQTDLPSAEPLIEESIRLFRELGDERGTALAVGSAGIAAIGEKRYEEGIALLEEAGSLYRKLGDEWGLTAVLVSAAGAWLALGDHGRAQQTAGEGLELARKLGDRTGISIALHVLATVAYASGDLEHAKELFGEGLALAAELGDEANVVYYLEELGAVCASEGKPDQAARVWGAAEALLEEIEATAYPHRPDDSLHLKRVVVARASLDEASWTAGWSEGRAMPLERAVRYALAPEVPAPYAVPGKLLGARVDGPPAEDILTRREQEIAALLAQGLTNRQIASKLSISGRTVETHARNILGKLGLKSRFQLAERYPGVERD